MTPAAQPAKSVANPADKPRNAFSEASPVPGPPSSFHSPVNPADPIDRIRRMVAFAKGVEGSWAQTESRRRKVILDAAREMLRLVTEGHRRTALYAAVGLSREEGRHYLRARL